MDDIDKFLEATRERAIEAHNTYVADIEARNIELEKVHDQNLKKDIADMVTAANTREQEMTVALEDAWISACATFRMLKAGELDMPDNDLCVPCAEMVDKTAAVEQVVNDKVTPITKRWLNADKGRQVSQMFETVRRAFQVQAWCDAFDEHMAPSISKKGLKAKRAERLGLKERSVWDWLQVAKFLKRFPNMRYQTVSCALRDLRGRVKEWERLIVERGETGKWADEKALESS